MDAPQKVINQESYFRFILQYDMHFPIFLRINIKRDTAGEAGRLAEEQP